VEQIGYTPMAKGLHWLVALLIFIQFPLGWIMDSFSGIQKFQAYNWHKSIGITVLSFMVLRLLWRLLNPPPALPSSMRKLERIAAHLGHLALYAVIFLITFAGWAMISVSDKPSVLFQYTRFPLVPWLSDLPAAQKKDYLDFFKEAHELLGYVLLTLLAVHIAAAARHAFLLKDGVSSRMIPRLRSKPAALHAAFVAILSFLCLGGGENAFAYDWTVKPEASQIAFEAKGGGYTAKGTFGQYKAEIEFDPELPAETSIRILFNMSTALTGTAGVDDALKSADYFNPGQFPTAQYVAKGAQPNGNGTYVLNGRLTLKGITKPVALPFSIAIESGTADVTAETKINRLDFGVGPQSVAGLDIDKDVKLTISLKAVRLDN
jgi:cytochrome b561/polyisoprenoid-binding protein YceI